MLFENVYFVSLYLSSLLLEFMHNCVNIIIQFYVNIAFMYFIPNQDNKKFLPVAGDNFILSKTVIIHHKPWTANFSGRDGHHSMLAYFNGTK